MKSLFSSKVFWLAVIQGIIALVVVFQTSFPQAGYLLMVKSVLDVILRIATTQPVTL